MGQQYSKIATQDIMFVGLDNSGKSTTIKQILGHESLASTKPTMGFESFSYYFPQQAGCRTYMRKFNMIDLGGHEKIRAIWRNYYDTSLGLVFVFDASDVHRYPEVKIALHQVLEANSSKYVLICANKQDLSCSIQTSEQFQAEFGIKLTPQMQFQPTVGILDQNQNLKNGMEWLLNHLSEQDTSKVDENRAALKNKRRFAGLTEEEKMDKLKAIKKENDEYEERLRQEKEAKRIQIVELEHQEILQPGEEIQDMNGTVLQNSKEQKPGTAVLPERDVEEDTKPSIDGPEPKTEKPARKRRAKAVLSRTENQDADVLSQ
ncbi:ADP-ribosylation_factor [Hexamita inflata]|uniref:ADP-ribosylation factor n=1 Tax=Hexamita inflata TaxID=28002 RepID=A0AA86QKA2_9EUKA|nr:ADP-ribosylation factor [Hexamita inflata]